MELMVPNFYFKFPFCIFDGFWYIPVNKQGSFLKWFSRGRSWLPFQWVKYTQLPQSHHYLVCFNFMWHKHFCLSSTCEIVLCNLFFFFLNLNAIMIFKASFAHDQGLFTSIWSCYFDDSCLYLSWSDCRIVTSPWIGTEWILKLLSFCVKPLFLGRYLWPWGTCYILPPFKVFNKWKNLIYDISGIK